MATDLSGKRCALFDLDETLVESGMGIVQETALLLEKLAACVQFMGVISGASFPQIKKQLLDHVRLFNLLAPTSGAQLYEFDPQIQDWKLVYTEVMSTEQCAQIRNCLNYVLGDSDYFEDINNFLHMHWISGSVEKWGMAIEEKGSQITFSGLKREVPPNLRRLWDKDFTKRQRIIDHLKKWLPHFEIKLGGTTSIDITLSGIDKGYGARKIMEHFQLSPAEIVFVGDQLQPGGNDEPIKLLGVDCIPVRNPSETQQVIYGWLANNH